MNNPLYAIGGTVEWANILDGLKTDKPHLKTDKLTSKTEKPYLMTEKPTMKTETSDQAGSGTGFRRTGKINEEKEEEADSL